MTILGTLHDVGDYLDARSVPWAVIGGLAVSARAVPRFTLDVALAVAVDSDESAEHIVRDLLHVGCCRDEQESAHRFAGVQLVRPSTPGSFGIDLMFASSGIEAEVTKDASRIELVPGAVAQIPHLIALKVLSRDERRPQDDADLQSLVAVASTSDLSVAADLLRIITDRGFSREKDLAREVDAIIDRFGGPGS